MARMCILYAALLAYFLIPNASLNAAQTERDFSPGPQEQQLPGEMHSKMDILPTISLGLENADLAGKDNRVLQAAVDYIAMLGGGTVEIGPGTYTMHDSLHLRSNVRVTGVKGKTILQKADSVVSPLVLDGDFGEQQITVEKTEGFAVGCGVAIWDDNAGGFHTTVARITGQNDHTFSIDKPLMADCMVNNNAKAATVFPIVSAYDTENIRIENLIIDGSKASNVPLNGCRGAGIFLYRSHGAVIQGCIVRDYNGDGISFQQSNDVTVSECISQGNTSLGLHPGSGSQRTHISKCIAKENGTDGLFLCWRVRHGIFENNILEQNGRFGISIGHKDSDNLLRQNIVRNNKENGVFFRNETQPMAPHRNRLEENVIEDNGGAEIRIRGYVNDIAFVSNTIRDSRSKKANEENAAILIENTVGPITMEKNKIENKLSIDDRRPSKEL